MAAPEDVPVFCESGTTTDGCLASILPSKENCPIAELITIVEDRKANSGSPLLQISEIAASSKYRELEEKRIASIATDEMLEINNPSGWLCRR